MVDKLVEELAATCEGAVTGQASLAAHTTLRVGGPARVLVEAERDEDLAAIGRAAERHDLRVLIVGRGSNLLVPDEGWRGIVLMLGDGFAGTEITPNEDGAVVRSGAAEPLPRLAVTAARHGLGRMAWGVGVPGSVGGGLRMNAGAHGDEMVDVVVEADLFRLGSGTRETWSAPALGFQFRRSNLPADGVVLSVTMQLPHADPAEERAKLDEIRRWRRERQPLEHPNCGSVFRNPPGDAAARLIDTAGIRGVRHGGASQSDKHVNFIVTEPGASASDVKAVMDEIHRRVMEVHGVDLASELVIVS